MFRQVVLALPTVKEPVEEPEVVDEEYDTTDDEKVVQELVEDNFKQLTKVDEKAKGKAVQEEEEFDPCRDYDPEVLKNAWNYDSPHQYDWYHNVTKVDEKAKGKAVQEPVEEEELDPCRDYDPEVLKYAWNYDSPDEDAYYHDPYEGEHGTDSDYCSDDDCRWK